AHSYGTAVTEDFQAACEAASGRNLTKFFQQWVYGERYPVYHSSWARLDAGGGFDVVLTLGQRQSWQLFTPPVDVRWLTDLGPRDSWVRAPLASQPFALHVAALPSAVEIDPDDWILKQVDRPVVQPPFDRPVLLVNGVDWAALGAEISPYYSNQVF